MRARHAMGWPLSAAYAVIHSLLVFKEEHRKRSRLIVFSLRPASASVWRWRLDSAYADGATTSGPRKPNRQNSDRGETLSPESEMAGEIGSANERAIVEAKDCRTADPGGQADGLPNTSGFDRNASTAFFV